MFGRSTLVAGAFAGAAIFSGSIVFAESDAQSIRSIMDVSSVSRDVPVAGHGVSKKIFVSGRKSGGRNHLQADSSKEAHYRPMIARHAAANGVPFALADAVVRVESRYNPNARNGPSLGLAQINLRTAQGLGYSGGAAGLYNPETNLTYAMKYLAQAYRMAGGDTCGTVMRYQNGHASRTFTGANRAYCSKVRAHLAFLGGRKQNA